MQYLHSKDECNGVLLFEAEKIQIFKLISEKKLFLPQKKTLSSRFTFV